MITKKYFKIAFFIASIVVLFSALIQSGLSILDFRHGDKVGHFVVFFVLSFLLNRASSSYKRRIRNVIALLAFGILIEILQSFTTYRSPSFWDVIADLLGILTFQFMLSLYRTYHQYFKTLYQNYFD